MLSQKENGFSPKANVIGRRRVSQKLKVDAISSFSN
jgi:hypothetical protein